VEDQIIEDLIDNLARESSGGNREKLEKRVHAEGMSMTELKEQARERAAVQIFTKQIIYGPVNISPKELHDYYRQHLTEFSEESRLALQVLLLKKNGRFQGSLDQLVDKLKQDVPIADEERFTVLVKLYSDGPKISQGGRIGWIARSKLRSEFLPFLKAAETGDKFGPISTAEGHFFLRVDNSIPVRVKDFNSAKEEILQKLQEQGRQRRYDEFIRKLKNKAVIRYF